MSVQGARAAERPASRRRLDAAGGMLCGLALLVACALIEPLASLSVQVSKNYNEGWNAYYALRAIEDQPLYPRGEPLLINNYPPLSFYAVGGLGMLVGDHVIAGRIVSLLACLVIAAAIAVTVRLSGASRPAGIVAGLVFLGVLRGLSPDYVGVNDPQLLAHAIATAGLAVLIARPRSISHLTLGAGLMVLAGLFKHNLVALPLAVTVWLALDHRAVLKYWLLAAPGFAALGMALVLAAYGFVAVESMLAGRLYTPAHALDVARDVLLIVQIPLVAWLILAICDRHATESRLIAAYGLVALLVGFALAGGADVNRNVFFDLVIALALACGLLFARLADWLERQSVVSSARGALVLALVVGIGAALPLDPIKRVMPGFAERSRALVEASRADIAWLRALEGPALCRTLALCYWAGKPFEVDPFNLQQAILTGRLDPELLRSRLAGREFAGVQWPPEFPLAPPLADALRRHYEKARSSANGDFFVPRSER